MEMTGVDRREAARWRVEEDEEETGHFLRTSVLMCDIMGDRL